MNIKIEHNVPMPSKRGYLTNDLVGVLRKMKIGDSFLCDAKTANSFPGVAPRYGLKVTGRQQPDGQVRLWRIE